MKVARSAGRLRELRRYRGMTQERPAERAGLSRDVVTKLEQGVRASARIDTLAWLAAALGVPLAALFDNEQDPPPPVRSCAGCGAPLSRYNPKDKCLPCADLALATDVGALRREAAILRDEVARLRCERRALARPDGGR